MGWKCVSVGEAGRGSFWNIYSSNKEHGQVGFLGLLLLYREYSTGYLKFLIIVIHTLHCGLD